MSNAITLDADMLQALAGKAILDSLSSESREQMIQSAINWLIAPVQVTDSYGRKQAPAPSPLQESFQRALHILSNKIADEVLTNDTKLQDSIRELITEAANKAVLEDRATIVYKVSQSISRVLQGDN